MATAAIYHHEDRGRAEDFCRSLELEGYDITFAPLGLEVGTQNWRRAVERILAEAEAFVFFLTAKAAVDEAVAWRVEIAISADRIFVPIQLDNTLPDEESWALPKTFFRFQRFMATEVNRIHYCQLELRAYLPKSSRPLQCFISYARKDEGVAARLKTDLVSKGVKAWRDLDDIPAGASWDKTIERSISECSHFLFLVTPASVESSNVSDEVSYAIGKQKVILPLLIESAPLPLRIHRAQTIEFRWDYAAGFEALLRRLEVES